MPGSEWPDSEPREHLISVCSFDFHAFPSAAVSGSDPDSRTWYAEDVGKEPHEFSIGRAVYRWSGEANLHGLVVPAGDFGPAGVWLDVDGERGAQAWVREQGTAGTVRCWVLAETRKVIPPVPLGWVLSDAIVTAP